MTDDCCTRNYYQTTNSDFHIPTVTINVHIFVFPALSVAVHVTSVLPLLNVDPDSGLHAVCTSVSILSDALGAVQVTTLLLDRMSFGHSITGSVLSVQRNP